MLGDDLPSGLQLQALAGRPEAASDFATAAYVALREALARLGAEEVYVSEAAARRAYKAAAGPAAPAPEAAARLALALVEAR